MTAHFLISNKQFWGKVGDILYVDKISNEIEEVIKFDKVLLLDGKIGKPYLDGASVECKVIKHGKNKKIHVLKFKSQKRHRKVTGFRRQYTKIEITKINAK